VLVEPDVGSKPEKGSPSPLTLKVKYPFVFSVGVSVGYERFIFLDDCCFLGTGCR